MTPVVAHPRATSSRLPVQSMLMPPPLKAFALRLKHLTQVRSVARHPLQQLKLEEGLLEIGILRTA